MSSYTMPPEPTLIDISLKRMAILRTARPGLPLGLPPRYLSKGRGSIVDRLGDRAPSTPISLPPAVSHTKVSPGTHSLWTLQSFYLAPPFRRPTSKVAQNGFS